MMHAENLQESMIALLNKSGIATDLLHIEKCENGKNNRTYRVETTQGLYAIKKYFHQPEDKHDRLASEFAFLAYAKKLVPNQVPTPYAYDVEKGLALYEFIDGIPFKKNTLTENDINQAIHFFCELNTTAAKMSATELPLAAEACFTIQAHIDLIDARINELQNISPETAQDQLAHDLIEQLKLSWLSHIKSLKNLKDFNSTLDISQRCLSPSDFGFHNVLRRKEGGLCFLDFEYAGWDDPAKMVGDFFSQLAIPVPASYFDYFARSVMAPFPKSEALVRRAYLLRYFYQVKWCCIALNIFLPTHLARRRFANPMMDVAEMKNTQLKKVATLMKNMGEMQSCQ